MSYLTIQGTTISGLLNNNKLKSLLFIATLGLGCAGKPDVQQQSLQTLPVVTIRTDTASTFNEYPSSIEGVDNIEIRPEISGKLKTLYIDEGSYVTKGQLLFKIEDHPFVERLRNAKDAVRASQGALTSARIEVEKLTALVANKVVSAYQLKTAAAVQETAEAALEQARAGVNTALIELEYTKITAPVSGFLSRLNRKRGSFVSANDTEPIARISDIQKVHVYFSMSETDFLNFKGQYKGATIEEKLENTPGVRLLLADKTLYSEVGRIDMVDGQFDETTGAITLRATFPNPDKILRSGNTGKIRLSVVYENIAVVPQDATMEMQDKIFVFALGDSNKVSKKPIEISGKSDRNYFVRRGIKSGTRIIASGLEHISEGEKIIPQK